MTPPKPNTRGKGKEKEPNSPSSENQEAIGEDSSKNPTNLPGFSAEQAESLAIFISTSLAAQKADLMEQFIATLSEMLTPLLQQITPRITKITLLDDFKEEVEQKHIHTPDVIVKSKPLTADTVGFFQPDYQDGTSTAVTNIGKQTVYRDVYVFINRLKDMAFIHGKDVIRDLLPEYLRGNEAIM